MAKHNELGKQGEAEAADFLAKKGYQILDRNWRFGRAELDIVAMQDGTTLVFVEVKTRSDDVFERPESAVDGRKRQLLARAAAEYMRRHEHNWAIRFDILSIILRGDVFYFDHFEDAFFPPLA